MSVHIFLRIIFFVLIISSLSCNCNCCADCFQSFSEQRLPEYSKCRALNHFRIKNKHNKLFIMLELNCVNVHSNTHHRQHCKSQNRLAVQAILEIFSQRLKAHACFDRLEYSFKNDSSLFCKIVKDCILLYEVCMIKTGLIVLFHLRCDV